MVERIEVDGLGDDWWILAEDLETLETADFKPRTALLSPFDNLLCDRARTDALFGFFHRLEIYVPKPKRRWGYFVLPVLDGERLVARIDLAIDRKRSVLSAIAVHKEPDAPRGKRLPQAIRKELERLAAWRGATGIEVLAGPARMASCAGRLTVFSSFRLIWFGAIGSWAACPHERGLTWMLEGCAPPARHWSRWRCSGFAASPALAAPGVSVSALSSLKAGATAGTLSGKVVNDSSRATRAQVAVRIMRRGTHHGVIGRTAVKVAAHGSAAYRVAVKLPAGLTKGNYYLSACTAQGHRRRRDSAARRRGTTC